MAFPKRSFGDEDLGPQIIIVSTVFTSLATLAVMGRFYARKLKRLELGADDWTTLAALILNWAFFAVTIKSIQLGLGRHLQLVNSPDNIRLLLILLYVASIIYKLGAAAIKASLLLLYKRVFISRGFKWLVCAVGAYVLTYGLVLVLLTAFACSPVEASWTGKGSCPHSRTYAISYAVLNIVADCIVWLMPIPTVWSLQMPIGHKIGLSFVFLLGLFDTGAAIARLAITLLSSTNSSDFTWYDAVAYEWSIIEVSTGILCSCLPTMRVVLLGLIPESAKRFFSAASSRTSQQTRENQANHTPYSKIGADSRVKELRKGFQGQYSIDLHDDFGSSPSLPSSLNSAVAERLPASPPVSLPCFLEIRNEAESVQLGVK